MAKKFLQEIASFIKDNYKNDYKDLAIIVPNKRAGIFLEKFLKEEIKKTVWAPRFYSIEEFIFETTGYQKASSTDLIFELYEVYLKHNPAEKQSFDDFSSWAPRLINDFNDIDSYIADYKVVFNFLSEARNLQKWNLDRPQLTEIETNYLQFYQHLKSYYSDFKSKLKSLNTAYPGMAIRELVSHISDYKIINKHFVLAGFNALTIAEEKLFEHLVIEYKAHIFWDVDDYYLKDARQEAGRHIRKNITHKYYNGKSIINKGFRENKKISINGLTGDYSMIKYAGKVLENWMSKEDFDANDTAIILPDEELLFPLVNSLPEKLNEMNITMSYPFKKSEAYDLIIRILELYISASRIHKTNIQTDSIILHHNAIKKLLNTSLFKYIYGNSKNRFLQKVKSENLTLLTFKQAIEIADEVGMTEHNPWKFLDTKSLDVHSVLNKITAFLDFIESKQIKSGLDRDLLLLNQNIINQLLKKIENHNVIENISTLKNFYKTLTSLKGIPFEGKPLAGLQIMGILETRALDFKNIIYLSFNEGVFPRSTQFKSFILPEIRREFSLPMPLDDDAIMAYHFYRSIQRAENISLIYNTTTGGMGGGEMSRFAMQLSHEISKSHPHISIENKTIKLPNTERKKANEVEIAKTDGIMKSLINMGGDKNKGFSPTSLTTFISCSLKFYFSKILKIKAPDEVEEELAANTRGTVIHGTLEMLYENEIHGANKFDETFYASALKNYYGILDAQYKAHFKKGDTDHGYNLLYKSLDNKMIKDFLQAESKESHGITEVKCEEDIAHFFKIETGEGILKIRIHGLADRIDFHKGIRRIMDYKTGKVSKSDLNLDSTKKDTDKWVDMFTKNSSPKAFQLLTYALIYIRSNDTNDPIIPMIAGLKSKEKYFYLNINKSPLITDEILDSFEEELTKVVQQIYDRDLPFSQTSDEKTCQYCEYKAICNKNE